MPPTPTTHHYPPLPTTTHHQSKYFHQHPPTAKYIHHHQTQPKIYPSKMFYKKNVKIFHSKVKDEKHFD